MFNFNWREMSCILLVSLFIDDLKKLFFALNFFAEIKFLIKRSWVSRGLRTYIN